jgi:ATP-dependent protease HslVU (ClpYQ) peptidase subunit
MGNILYDPVTSRASLIDVETCHEGDMSPEERAADDLLVVLLDVVGRAAALMYRSYCESVIHAYAGAAPHANAVFQALETRLVEHATSAGLLERAVWATRTEYQGESTLNQRLVSLRALLNETIARAAPGREISQPAVPERGSRC